MKAVLVTFTQTVRIVINGDTPTQEEYDSAFIKCQEVMSTNGPNDSWEETADDHDCPYGSLQGETPQFSVIVGNVGTMPYCTREEAEKEYYEYVNLSQSGSSLRVSGEPVTLMERDEILLEYNPKEAGEAEPLVKGKSYSYRQIETFAQENNYEMEELGGETIGKAFIVLTHNNRDINLSFILTGYNSAEGNLYTCIYSDLQTQ